MEMIMPLESTRNWNPEVPFPDSVNHITMQAVVTGYFSVYDTIEKLYGIEPRSAWLENLADALKSFEARSLRDMRTYAARTEPGRWVLATGLPIWAAAGMQCGIMPGATIRGPSTLWMFCGMEHRKYTPVDRVREIMQEVLGHHPKGSVNDQQLLELGERLDRHPGPLLGAQPNAQDVFRWATKRRYSEFLRTIAIRLGDWMQQHKQNLYHDIYLNSLEKEGEQSLNGTNVALADLERYARTSAVRQFLSDYYARLPIVLKRPTTNS